jgi:5-(carboxyamino)imidazole ribonucleotide mutase
MTEVGIIMGSDSDWPTMRAAAEVLDEFGVAHEVAVVSAHRTPQRMLQYATEAAGRGLKLIIAGAGGAAHLPGMVAAATPLPVIGVPVPLAHLDGLDSLLSIVQMPAGVPVATVSIGGARNAGLLAVRMLGIADPALCERMSVYQAGLAELVAEKDAALQAARDRSAHPAPSAAELLDAPPALLEVRAQGEEDRADQRQDRTDQRRRGQQPRGVQRGQG